VAVIGVASLALAALALSWLGLLPNVGLPGGYYGNLNRARARLRGLANVEILGVRENHDLTLEDFTIDLRIDGRYRVSLFFPNAETQKSWQLLDAANKVVLRRQRDMSTEPSTDAHDSWVFNLQPGGDLENALGCKVRGGRDVLEHFGAILNLVDKTTPQALGRPVSRDALYITVSADAQSP
jgi:hypothetical protein